jgi:hypothetical protein
MSEIHLERYTRTFYSTSGKHASAEFQFPDLFRICELLRYIEADFVNKTVKIKCVNYPDQQQAYALWVPVTVTHSHLHH